MTHNDDYLLVTFAAGAATLSLAYLAATHGGIYHLGGVFVFACIAALALCVHMYVCPTTRIKGGNEMEQRVVTEGLPPLAWIVEALKAQEGIFSEDNPYLGGESDTPTS